jgi:hypothetical protein
MLCECTMLTMLPCRLILVICAFDVLWWARCLWSCLLLYVSKLLHVEVLFMTLFLVEAQCCCSYWCVVGNEPHSTRKQEAREWLVSQESLCPTRVFMSGRRKNPALGHTERRITSSMPEMEKQPSAPVSSVAVESGTMIYRLVLSNDHVVYFTISNRLIF